MKEREKGEERREEIGEGERRCADRDMKIARTDKINRTDKLPMTDWRLKMSRALQHEMNCLAYEHQEDMSLQ